MAGPNDYTIGGVVDPTTALMQGVQAGAGLRALPIQQQLQDIQLQGAQQGLLQQQQALQQQQQQARVINDLLSKPNATAQDYANASLILPSSMREQVKQAHEMRTTDQQQAVLQDTGKVFAALTSGQPAVAAQLLRGRAELLKPTDPQQASIFETMAGMADAHPAFARSLVGMHLASLPGGDKVITNLSGMGKESREQQLQPGVVAKGAADASTAQSEAVIKGVQAGNAPTATVLGNEKTAQEIKASQLAGDISRIDAQIKGEDSVTKRGELQLQRDKLVIEQQKLGKQEANQAQDSQNATTNALQTLAQITSHPAMKGWNRPGEWSGAMVAKMPGTERHALDGWVDGLKGQLSFQNLMGMKAASPAGASGLGALSEGEMRMLSGLAGNLDTNSRDFNKQLAGVEKFLQKAQSTVSARGNLPNAGEAYVMKHPTYGSVTEGTINDLMRKTPGVTREQVLGFLKATGGN